MRCETGEFPIKIIQGDSYRRVYKFYDTDGNVMDNSSISSVVLSVSRLNYTQTLNWNPSEEGYVFILSADTTAEFPYCKGTYDVTLNFRDTQVSTQVYQSSWQIFEKDVFYNTITNNNGYMTCENSEVVIKTGITVSAGGAGGTDDHNLLYNRDLPNQHSMSAITGLEDALDGKQPSGDYATSAELDALADIVDGKADASAIPTKTSDLTNDSGFLTSIPSEYVTSTELDTALQGVRDDIPTNTSDLTNDSDFTTNTYVDGEVNDLQSQIDAIVSQSDVVDIVGTYAELLAYDTQHLHDNDIVKVLDDSTHSNARSYYRWVVVGSVGSWMYVGSEAISYTKAEEDALLATKQDVITDLTTIRSGASAGATAVQPSALNAYRTASAQDIIDAGKQPLISDLATIRSGAALGATAVQPEAGKGLFSGNYNDLTNKPTIPTVPQNVSAFTNDSGYLTLATLPIYNGEVV